MTDHAHSESHAHGPSYYVKIWAILLALLIVSICGPMVGIRWLTLLTAFGIAVVKALMVASEFMHIRYEKKIITYILVTMLLLMAVFFYGVAPDVMTTGGTNWERHSLQADLEPAAPAHHEESGHAAEHAEGEHH